MNEINAADISLIVPLFMIFVKSANYGFKSYTYSTIAIY
jgi:hypothetical protein